MIDCENEVYTRIADRLRKAVPGIDISGVYVNIPSAFPHVSIEQSDSRVVKKQTDGEHEMAEVSFEVNVYSNARNQRKSEANNIANLIDEMLFGMNFRRISRGPTPNPEDLAIYRITARYSAYTDGQFFYRS